MFDRITPVVKNLIIINVLIYLVTIALSMKGVDLSDYLGLHYWQSDGFQPHQFITYMFMHSSINITHVLFNMFAVLMFGKLLEGVWGSKRFLIYYMATGLGAGIIQMLVTHLRLSSALTELPPEVVDVIMTEGYNLICNDLNYIEDGMRTANGLLNGATVGASGAVFGILLAFGMLFPNTQLMLLFPPIPIKAKWFVLGYGVIELYLGFSNNPYDNVAHFAHLGGMLIGILLLKYWQTSRTNFY